SVKDVMALCAKLREAGMTGKAIDSADESFGPDSMFGKVMSLAEGRSEFDGAFKPNPEKLKEVIDKALGGFPPVSGMAAPINMSGGVSADGSDINY
ncbi:MAG: hypothetical protein JWP52_315, partial [Rhizobacter sp.]|nr:hypothetical protein [Rhizobacter sp.]